MEVYAIFFTRKDFIFFVMSLDFAEIKNIENMSMGMIYMQDASNPSPAIF